MTREDVAAHTRANTLKLLSQVFNYSLRQRWCRENPCLGVRRPRILPSSDIRFLDKDELEAVTGAIDVTRKPFGAIDCIAAHWERCSPWCSSTRATALSLTSGGYLRFRDMTSSSQGIWSPSKPGRFKAAFNAGLLRQQRGDMDGAVEAWRLGRSLGDLGSTHSLGRALQEAGDIAGAIEAFREGDENGDAESAFSLGALLYEQEKPAEALEAFSRSAERGKDGVRDLIAQLLREHPELDGDATSRPTTVGDLLEQYQASHRPPIPSIQVAPLAEGEERLVQVVHRADGNRNDVYLIHSGPSTAT